MIHKHEFKTVDGKSASVELKNSLRNDIAESTLSAQFATEEYPDHVQRSNFCLFMAHVVPGTVKGIDWQPVDDSATEDQFTACYHGFAELVDAQTAYACAMAVVQMSRRTDPLEKPDPALTPDEEADPN